MEFLSSLGGHGVNKVGSLLLLPIFVVVVVAFKKRYFKNVLDLQKNVIVFNQHIILVLMAQERP